MAIKQSTVIIVFPSELLLLLETIYPLQCSLGKWQRFSSLIHVINGGCLPIDMSVFSTSSPSPSINVSATTFGWQVASLFGCKCADSSGILTAVHIMTVTFSTWYEHCTQDITKTLLKCVFFLTIIVRKYTLVTPADKWSDNWSMTTRCLQTEQRRGQRWNWIMWTKCKVKMTRNVH